MMTVIAICLILIAFAVLFGRNVAAGTLMAVLAIIAGFFVLVLLGVFGYWTYETYGDDVWKFVAIAIFVCVAEGIYNQIK